jgi:hypothetical protein
MSLIHIANYATADRWSAIADEDMPLGCLVTMEALAGGGRKAAMVNAANDLVAGNYYIAFKVSTDAMAVSKSTAALKLGDRTLSIKAGDQIVLVAPGAIVEYDATLLDASLNPAAGGTLPAVSAKLAIKGAKWAATNAASAIADPLVGEVFDVFSNKVQVLLTVPHIVDLNPA